MSDARVEVKQEGRIVVEDVSVAYGKVPAVRNVTLVVEPGEVVVLAGPNSAGKSSLLNGIATKSRWVEVTGRISIGRQRIDGMPTRHRWASGLRLVPQGRQIFPSLDAEDNLRVVADNLGIPWTEAIQNGRRPSLRSLELGPFRDAGGESERGRTADACSGEGPYRKAAGAFARRARPWPCPGASSRNWRKQ